MSRDFWRIQVWCETPASSLISALRLSLRFVVFIILILRSADVDVHRIAACGWLVSLRGWQLDRWKRNWRLRLTDRCGLRHRSAPVVQGTLKAVGNRL